MPRVLTIGKDLLVVRQLTAWDPALKKNTKEAAADLVATCRITARTGEDGDPAAPPIEIHASLKYDTAELTADATGFIWCNVRGIDSVNHLKPYIGKVVYACITVAGTTYIDYEPLLVKGNSIVPGAG